MVSEFVFILNRLSIIIATFFYITQGSWKPRCSSSSISIDVTQRLQVVSQQLSPNRLSPQAFEIMLFSWKRITQKNFSSLLRQWLSFCINRHYDSSAPSVTSVLNFLTSMYERGIGHSHIKRASSALSSMYPDVAISKHPLISRFVRGVRNL